MTKPQTQTRISGRNTDATEPNTRGDRQGKIPLRSDWLNKGIEPPESAPTVTPPGKHTPGPWHLSEEFSSSPSGQSYRSNAITAHGKLVGRAQGFSEANARIIAAAPELLAALKASTRVLSWLAHPSTDELAALNDARAAIAKASG